MNERPFLECFDLIIQVAEAEGAAPLKGRVWTCRIDESWTIAINGFSIPVNVKPKGAMKIKVPPVNAAVWFNGWLAGLLTPYEGTIAAGELANEETFIAALKKKLEALL